MKEDSKYYRMFFVALFATFCSIVSLWATTNIAVVISVYIASFILCIFIASIGAKLERIANTLDRIEFENLEHYLSMRR